MAFGIGLGDALRHPVFDPGLVRLAGDQEVTLDRSVPAPSAPQPARLAVDRTAMRGPGVGPVGEARPLNLLYLTRPIEEGDASEAELRDLFTRNVVVFRLKTRRLEVSPHPHAESFSVKTVFSGLERYHFEDREVGVAPREALLVAPGRTYGSAIRSAEVTDSFSIFFPERWFQEQIGGTGAGPVLRLLDAGASSASLPLTADIADAIRDLARALDRTDGDPLASQETLAAVTARLFGFVQASGETADRIDAALPSTRLELLRRVSRVRDLLEGRVEAGVTLTELAREACLSEFHLLRVFKQAFGVTPARYLDGLRMERARALLLETDQPVAEVAAACGFASPSAFGRAFRRRWGISATSLRQTRSDASLDEVS